MTTTEFALDEIGQISIRAKNLAESTAFYRDKLGMKFLFDAPPKLAFFQCGGVRLMVTEPEPEFDHPSSILYYKVADIDSAYAALRERGVEFRGEPQLTHKAEDHELWIAAFVDPAGNTMALMCEKR